MSTLSRRLTAAIAAVALGALPPVVVQAAAAGSAANDSLEEVIVTAQKREERLIDVPMAITEVSAVELSEQNLDQMSQYYSRIPSLQYAGNKTYNLSLRGVTTGLGGRLSQCFGLVEEPGLPRMRFAAGPEHAPTGPAQLLVELEDACLEGLLQFSLAHLDGGFLLASQRLELGR